MTGGRQLELEFVRAAEALVGAPYRVHGRDPVTGLDCVGVCIAALGSIGRRIDMPCSYSLRNSSVDDLMPYARQARLARAKGVPRSGDILLLQLSSVQYHLVITAGDGACVHAHAGLRLVVKGPLPAPSHIIRHWRLA